MNLAPSNDWHQQSVFVVHCVLEPVTENAFLVLLLIVSWEVQETKNNKTVNMCIFILGI